MNIEHHLYQAMQAAQEASHSGIAHGMEHVVRHIEDALASFEDVVWGDLDEPLSFPMLEVEE